MKKILVILLLLLPFAEHYTQEKRDVRDKVGFCWDASEMERFVSWLNKNSSDNINFKGRLIAAISVHDDYLYAGKVYHPLFKLIDAKEVIILGVTHSTVRKELGTFRNKLILENHDAWTGIYNDVKISPLREIIKKKLDRNYYVINNRAHQIEHSIEAVIPFLQFYNKEIKITPVMVTAMNRDTMEIISKELSEIISQYIIERQLTLGKDIFILISNDANHYGVDFNNYPYGIDEAAHKSAIDNDLRIINNYLVGVIGKEKIIGLYGELIDGVNRGTQPLWCGRYPLLFGLMTVKNVVDQLNLGSIHGALIKYSDTYTEKLLPFEGSSMGTTAPYSLDHWVGFFTLGFYIDRESR
ncbi:AmmeMemoRadiSam system protein B [Melioribacter sp. OK-6-Me]|uniref:AmmeMemoRadiSam system protein B n=1 Tax=unclassified Melioribacter TaxID=2627329 RepID=UPI003ED8941E